MKKFILPVAIACAFLLGLFSCIKPDDFMPDEEEQEPLKDYVCNCVYVAITGGPSEGEPNKEESTTLSQRTRAQAEFDCSQLDSKYFADYFDGTCLLE
jgi:hypothetical protein